jgi:diguanylate cyclase
MPPTQPQPSSDHRIYLGDTIVEELRASGLPLEPAQFEFWFAYKSGRNAALKAEADAIKARGGALSAEDIARMHARYLSPLRLGERPDITVTRLSGKLQDLALSIEDTIDAAQTQREAFVAETAELSVNAALTLQDVLGSIDRLTQSTRESQVRYALLEARMDAMSSEVRALRQQLSAVRTTCQADPTTALPNRTAFDAALAQALERAAAERQPLSVVLCNLDYFATFNENFGTFVGDQALRAICLLFKAHMRPLDTIARFSGDAFAAVLPGLRSREATASAERFRQVLMAQQLIPGVNGAGRVTVSIGVADATQGDTPEFLLRRVTNGLSVAKREGRNRVVEMTPDGPIWNAERRA